MTLNKAMGKHAGENTERLRRHADAKRARKKKGKVSKKDKTPKRVTINYQKHIRISGSTTEVDICKEIYHL